MVNESLSKVKKNLIQDHTLGLTILFGVQVFSTMSFAVMYATLVLYMKQKLGLSAQQADAITGVYFAYNFALHLLGGYIGGRFFSYRTLICVGLLFQILGGLILALGYIDTLYLGLACMLIGTGNMVTCINMLVSQFFDNDDIRREGAFLRNYSGMNIGFLLGFTLAGWMQLSHNYYLLFLLTMLPNLLTLGLMYRGWDFFADKNTPLSQLSVGLQRQRWRLGSLLLLLHIPVLFWLLKHETLSGYLVLALGGLMIVVIAWIAMRHHGIERYKLFTFLAMLLTAQIFWIIYQLAPMGLTLFAQSNVNRHWEGIEITSGWIQGINSVTIIIGGPLLAALLNRMRKHKPLSVALQYVMGLMLAALGMLILPVGIYFANVHGLMAFGWLFATYVLQAIAELLISPAGYSMVGNLVPSRLQSAMMGVVLMNAGVAAVITSYFSNYAMGSIRTDNPLITNSSYSQAFAQLGMATLLVAVALFVFLPQLHRWMLHRRG